MISRLLKIFAVFLIITSSLFGGDGTPQYYSQSRYLLTSPGAFGSGFLGYLNPALVNTVYSPELFIFSTNRNQEFLLDKQWGMIAAVPHLSVGAINHQAGDARFSDYRIACGFGDDFLSYGLSYGWTAGGSKLSGSGKVYSAGLLMRPNRYFSAGLTGIFPQERGEKYGVFELGFRPFGSDRIAIFGDCAVTSFSHLDRAGWSTGMVVQPLSGINIAARIFDNNTFSVGMSFSLGSADLRSQTHFDKNNKAVYNSHLLRIGSKRRNIFNSYFKNDKSYISMDLKGPVRYQKYRLFDDQGNTLMQIIGNLKGAAEDKRISGVALNLSGMKAGKENIWEIRELLLKLRSSGKKIVIYFDNCSITGYHLASAADRIVMDPEGMLILEGFAAGRTFMKGTLEKLGIGYEEWRFFKYKSATEVLSRESMSEPDREQRLKLIQDFYAIVQKDVCKSRGFSPAGFDTLINEKALFLPQDALKHQLVDTLARWTEIGDIISDFEGEKKSLINPQNLACNSFQRTEWGGLAQIAVVYAIGGCAMDTGIKARMLEKIILGLSKAEIVKAVILRVDSPGGDPLASDLVAEALKKCRKNKPVIISQGGVAASGGYWISMYGDTIIAAPNTITGSIGVIGGWIWDKGFGNMIGMKSDFVKAGKHADLALGVTLPYIGLTLPGRNLTREEYGIMKGSIVYMYHRFVSKVATGRGMKESEIDSLGQGRVWSGAEGKKNGLVDVIGGLDEAIKIAKERAGIPEHKKIEIIELPKKGLINPDLFKLRLFGIKVVEQTESPVISYLKMIYSFPAKPLVILPPDWAITD